MRRMGTLAGVVMLVSACSSPETNSPAVAHQFDHVMVGIADLDSGVAILEEMTGLTAAYGGIHPGRDTRNSLLSLGNGTYFELIAPQAGLETITDPIAQATLAFRTPTPMHWAVSTTDIEATQSMVEAAGWSTTAVDSRSRETPDGGLLSWRMFFISDADEAASIPFFIEWGADSAHPSQTSPAGCELADFSISTPNAERISPLIETLDLGLEVQDSEQDMLELVLSCAGGEVRF